MGGGIDLKLTKGVFFSEQMSSSVLVKKNIIMFFIFVSKASWL